MSWERDRGRGRTKYAEGGGAKSYFPRSPSCATDNISLDLCTNKFHSCIIYFKLWNFLNLRYIFFHLNVQDIYIIIKQFYCFGKKRENMNSYLFQVWSSITALNISRINMTWLWIYKQKWLSRSAKHSELTFQIILL